MRGRPKRLRTIRFMPEITYFKPAGVPLRFLEEEILTLDEIESVRLADVENMTQEEAAGKMNISRVTFLRIIDSAHGKIAKALIYGKAIQMKGGDVVMPNLDRTGPIGQGPMTGKGRGQQAIRPGQGLGGSADCECPKCGAKVSHTRGVPCSNTNCPKCGAPMRGIFCK